MRANPSMSGLRRRASGMTLIELIVAVAVLAILVAIAVPSFREISLRNRSTNAVNGLLADLALARSEAVKQQRNAYVTAAGGDWNAGWSVWVDANNNNANDGPPNEPALREQGHLNNPDMDTSNQFTLQAVIGATAGGGSTPQVGFGPMGQAVDPDTGARFALCRPDGDANKSVGVQIELSGRAASMRDLTILGLGCS